MNLQNIINLLKENQDKSAKEIKLLELVNQKVNNLEKAIANYYTSKDLQKVEEVWEAKETLGLLLYSIIKSVNPRNVEFYEEN